MNFTPGYVHQINNKTVLHQERQVQKQAARGRRQAYWLHANQALRDLVEGGSFGMDQKEIVEYRPTMEGILSGKRTKMPLLIQRGKNLPNRTHKRISFCLIKKKRDTGKPLKSCSYHAQNKCVRPAAQDPFHSTNPVECLFLPVRECEGTIKRYRGTHRD